VAAQEARDRAATSDRILGSLFICTVLYMLMAIVLTGITDWRTLNVPTRSLSRGQDPRSALAVIPVDIARWPGLPPSLRGALRTIARVLCDGADGFLPPLFSAVHARFRTPIAAPSSRDSPLR